ncbi:MAG: translation initiation factor IF-2 [Tannerella sp.]|jgi:translation initiation factor IF-2|nr:translation initiation factor IF-2 [Tannerella sp.]
MPIKLNKVIKDLNVGLSTIVEFLNKKGYEIESNPNVKISDEQFDLLIKEFGNGMPVKEKNAMIKPLVQMLFKEKPKVQEVEEIKTRIPDDIKPGFVIKGRIDLEDKSYKINPILPKAEEKVEKPEKPAVEKIESVVKPPVKEDIAVPEVEPKKNEPKVPEAVPEITVESVVPEAVREVAVPVEKEPEAVVEPELQPEPAPQLEPELQSEPEPVREETSTVEEEPAAAPKEEVVEEELFRLNKPHIEPNIKVTGKIDLSAINQATSPRKKTKEEKRREREERRERLMEQRKAYAASQANRSGEAGIAKPVKLIKPIKPVKPAEGAATDAGNRQKRKRIRKDRVDINNTPGTNTRRDDRGGNKPLRPKRPVRVEVNEEDVQKQVKETLARLTNKNSKGKAAKYRREKRDAAAHREQELLEEERRGSKVLKLTEFVTANDLANMMNVPVTQVISTCMSIGMMVSINQRLDAETINIVSEEFGFTTEYVSAEVVEAITEEVDREEDLVPRPPIITVMGHVDHGKTSLLDNIRNTNVIAGEAGGITQHIGAYNVKLPNGRHITFLDTPGHEAFTAMRARGARITDIVIIIVAADDNVMPQTVEAINHASAAGVPIVFAINKIDKPHANPEKIKEALANMNYLVEDWGGKYQSQEISAKQGTGLPELLEKVLLEADLLELKANPERKATGSIIESSLDRGRGFVSTVLVSNGTLKQGDVVLAGTHFGRIKAMFNVRNQRIEQAAPSEPAIILGLDGAPQAGDSFHVLETEQEAREIASRREQLQRELGLRTQKRFGLEELGRRRALGDFHELNLIVKGDVDGSIEALSDSLIKLSTEEIQVNVIHKAVGQISESDISLAETADAVIIGFQVRPSAQARRLAENEGVEVRLYSIIYDAINDVKDAMEGLLSPEIREDICGEVEVLQVFKISKVGTIAGCIVKEGKIKRTNKVRVIRDGIVVHTGDLASLKRFKDEAKEAVSGQDCGININNYNDVQVGDIIEPFDQTEIKKTL